MVFKGSLFEKSCWKGPYKKVWETCFRVYNNQCIVIVLLENIFSVYISLVAFINYDKLNTRLLFVVCAIYSKLMLILLEFKQSPKVFESFVGFNFFVPKQH